MFVIFKQFWPMKITPPTAKLINVGTWKADRIDVCFNEDIEIIFNKEINRFIQGKIWRSSFRILFKITRF